MNRINVDRMNALKVVRSKVQVTDTVMDMGSGIRTQDFSEPRVHICVDPHLPYLMHLNDAAKRKNRILISCAWNQIGYFEQTYESRDKSDRWGMDGGYWQRHRSGWLINYDFRGPLT